jgi:hypothetical protein
VAELPLTGGCLCGGVRYEIAEPLVSASYCHCTRCQRRTGTAASAQAQIVPGSLRIVRGAELIRTWRPPAPGFPKSFCSNCGGALWSSTPEDVIAGVRLGTFDEDPGIRPSFRIYTAYAVPWEPIPDDGTERYAEGKR